MPKDPPPDAKRQALIAVLAALDALRDHERRDVLGAAAKFYGLHVTVENGATT